MGAHVSFGHEVCGHGGGGPRLAEEAVDKDQADAEALRTVDKGHNFVKRTGDRGLGEVRDAKSLVANALLGKLGWRDVHIVLRHVQDVGDAQLDEVLDVLHCLAGADNDAGVDLVAVDPVANSLAEILFGVDSGHHTGGGRVGCVGTGEVAGRATIGTVPNVLVVVVRHGDDDVLVQQSIEKRRESRAN